MDPFEQLEMVWSSLQSWFDLLQVELDRVVKSESVSEVSDRSTPTNNSVETASESTDFEPESTKDEKVPTQNQSSRTPSQYPPTRPPPLSSVENSNSVLAAAIVNSAPSHRRTAFLQATGSIDHTSSSSSGSREKNLKRRSWHVDRVTARLLSSISSSNSLTHLPHFIRSVSIDSSNNVPGKQDKYLFYH